MKSNPTPCPFLSAQVSSTATQARPSAILGLRRKQRRNVPKSQGGSSARRGANQRQRGAQDVPSPVSHSFAEMRWLFIGLLISLGVLLLALAGMARHILVKRAELRSRPFEPIDPTLGPRTKREETDLER